MVAKTLKVGKSAMELINSVILSVHNTQFRRESFCTSHYGKYKDIWEDTR